MNRCFFSYGSPCKFKCLYCFAQFSNYKQLPADSQSDNFAEILYPTCDTEFSQSSKFVENLESIANLRPFTIFSISTKANLNDSFLAKLAKLDNEMRKRAQGFIKVGVSFSTKTRITEIEPKTASYESRINTLDRIRMYGLCSSVNLKPCLPFIPAEEYFEIISDTSFVHAPYLVGGLYLDKDSKFFHDYIEGKFPVTQRVVEWLPHRPVWPYVENTSLTKKICDFIIHAGLNHYLSDSHLLEGISKFASSHDHARFS